MASKKGKVHSSRSGEWERFLLFNKLVAIHFFVTEGWVCGGCPSTLPLLMCLFFHNFKDGTGRVRTKQTAVDEFQDDGFTAIAVVGFASAVH